LVFFISCKKEFSCKNCEANQQPIANAGTDQIITSPKDSVTLDASASTDPDGTITSYKWKKFLGPSSSSIIDLRVINNLSKDVVIGVYKFELTVTDNGGLVCKRYCSSDCEWTYK
jgi:chitodextrinase